MLRLVFVGNALPASFIVSPHASFQPGQVAQLEVVGNQVVAGVSNGCSPLGIIDDIRIRAFTAVQWNEVIVVPAAGVPSPQGLVTPIDIKTELQFPSIDSGSFISTVPVLLKPTNGVITFPAGTLLNFDLLGTGTPNAIRTVVNYTYQIPNIPGDDSVIGSGRVTVWFMRMIFQTDQFTPNVTFPVNANLYVNECGLFTTVRSSTNIPAVALVTAPPTPQNSLLEALWL